MTRRLCFALLLSSALWLLTAAQAGDSQTAPANSALAAADQLYTTGKFAEAADSYQAILKTDPKLVAAQVGLIRSLLREQKVDDALAAATSALAAQPNSPPLLAAMGDVDFRLAQMPEAEAAYQKALRSILSKCMLILDWQGFIGCTRSIVMHMTNCSAPTSSPRTILKYSACGSTSSPARSGSPPSRAIWLDRIPIMRKRQQTLKRYLDFLKALVDKPVHACRLVTKVEQTDTKLEAMRRDPTHIFGYGLIVKLNGHDARLQLDTGAGGIVIGTQVRRKGWADSHQPRNAMSESATKGQQSGYTALAQHIRVGELEFENCFVTSVTGRRSPAKMVSSVAMSSLPT